MQQTQTIKILKTGPPVKPGPRIGLIETGPQGRERLCGAALRVTLALDKKILILAPSNRKPSLQDVLRKVSEKGKKQGVRMGEELKVLRSVPADVLRKDLSTIAQAGRIQQEDAREMLGKELGSEFVTSVCLQIHELQGQIPQLMSIERALKETASALRDRGRVV